MSSRDPVSDFFAKLSPDPLFPKTGHVRFPGVLWREHGSSIAHALAALYMQETLRCDGMTDAPWEVIARRACLRTDVFARSMRRLASEHSGEFFVEGQLVRVRDADQFCQTFELSESDWASVLRVPCEWFSITGDSGLPNFSLESRLLAAYFAEAGNRGLDEVDLYPLLREFGGDEPSWRRRCRQLADKGAIAMRKTPTNQNVVDVLLNTGSMESDVTDGY